MKHIFILILISFTKISSGNELQCSLQPNVQSEQLDNVLESIKCVDDSRPATRLASRESFSKLLDKGMSAPIEDFLKLWNTSESEYDAGQMYFILGPKT